MAPVAHEWPGYTRVALYLPLLVAMFQLGGAATNAPLHAWVVWDHGTRSGPAVLALVDLRDARPVAQFALAQPEPRTRIAQLLCLGALGEDGHLCVLVTRYEGWPKNLGADRPRRPFKSITSALYTIDLDRMTLGRRLYSWPYEVWKAVAIPSRSLLFTAGMDGEGGSFHRRYDFNAGWDCVTDMEGVELSHCAVSPDSEYIWTVVGAQAQPYCVRRLSLLRAADEMTHPFPDATWSPGRVVAMSGGSALVEGWRIGQGLPGEKALLATEGTDASACVREIRLAYFRSLLAFDAARSGVWVLTNSSGEGALELRSVADGQVIDSIPIGADRPFGRPSKCIFLDGGRVLGLVWAADTHNPGLLAFADTSTREVVHMDMAERWLIDAIEARVTAEQVAAFRARAAQMEQTAGE